MLTAIAVAQPALTPIEQQWLQAAAPVLAFARAQRLPLDVVVQPQPRPGDVPLAMAFVAGRCKLVLTLRNRDDAEAVLDGVPDEQLAWMREAAVAHELAHCQRHVAGHWGESPAGFTDAESPGDATDLAAQRRAMRSTQREEGLADLVALAWTRSREPARYAAVHAWLTRLRDDQPVAGAHHDTRAWLRLATQPSAFSDETNPLDAAWPLWLQGLHADD